jgi:hypothetical protein
MLIKCIGGERLNLEGNYWDNIFPSTEFTIKQSYKYKHLLARQIRAFSKLSVAWSEEWSRRIFAFCGNDTIQLVKL